MPVQLFTEAERARRNRFPEVIVYEDLVTFFTLSEHDLERMPRSSAPHNRLGYALQLCALRFMGFVPDDLSTTPPEAVAFVAQQLAVEPAVLAAYGTRAHTRQDHLQPHLPEGEEERCAGQVVIPSCSLRFTRLSHSETVGDTAWADPPGRTHRTPTRRLSVSERARSRAAQPPGGMKLAEKEGKAPV
jgi:Domain of unknown function (DUF4158)